MQRIKLICLFILFFCSTVSIISSCSNGDDNSLSSSSLVGRWKNQNISYVFNANGTGYSEIDYNNIAPGLGVVRNSFKWSASDVQLFLTYEVSDSHVGGTSMYYYTLVDDVLAMYYSDGEYKDSYIRISR